MFTTEGFVSLQALKADGSTDGPRPHPHVGGIMDQRRGREPRRLHGFPRPGEREHLSGHPRQHTRHLLLPGQVPTSGLEVVGQSVGHPGHEAGQLQVPLAFLLQ